VIRLGAAGRQESPRVLAAAEPPVSACDAGRVAPPVGYPDTEGDIAGRLERLLRDLDLSGTMLSGGRVSRCLYVEETQAPGYAGTSPVILLRAEDDQAVSGISTGVTAREVRRAPVPLAAQEAQGSPDAEDGGGD
jgi:hypothetical protein